MLLTIQPIDGDGDETTRRNRRTRRWCFRICVFTCLASLVCGLIAARVTCGNTMVWSFSLQSFPVTCQAPSQTQKAGPPTIRVACVGDSITFGTGATSPQMTYPSQLQRLLGSQYLVKNFAGEGVTLMRQTGTMPQGGAMSMWERDEFRMSRDFSPNIVIIMLGTNDASKLRWCARYKEFVPSYIAFVNVYMSLPTKPRVYVVVPPPVFGQKYTTLAPVVNSLLPALIPAIGCATGAAFQTVSPDALEPLKDAAIPIYSSFDANCSVKSSWAKGNCSLMSDSNHPSNEGYGLIAEVVKAFILSTVMPEFDWGTRHMCSERAVDMTKEFAPCK